MATFINTNNTATSSSSKESWRADRFLNISVPTKDGGQKQIGGLALKMSDPNHKVLIEWLDQNPDNLRKLVNKMLFSYNDATPKSAEFDLD